MSSVADWALLYASAGWRSFPVQATKKAPLYRNWQADATLDPAMCRQYFPPGTDRNVGLVAGEAFHALESQGGPLAPFS